jgi:hypothetical protein
MEDKNYKKLTKEIIVRRLTINDEDKVKIISKDIYGGLDYLTKSFPKWAKDEEHHYCYGLFYNEDLVAFTCYTLFDDKKTVWMEAGRVYAPYREKNYFSMFNTTIKELFSKNIDIDYKRIRWTTAYFMTPEVLEERYKRKNRKLPYLKYFWYSITFDKEMSKSVLKKLEMIQKSKNEIIKIKGEEYHKNYKNDFFHINFRVMDNTLENVRIMEEGKNGQEKHSFYSNLDKTSFSIQTITKCTYDDCYGCSIDTIDEIEFINHLVFQFKEFQKTNLKYIRIFGDHYLMNKIMNFDKFVVKFDVCFYQLSNTLISKL